MMKRKKKERDPALEAAIDDLDEWFSEHPNLPLEIDRLLLKRFYLCTNCDVEDTKNLIELNYTLRNKHEEIFIDRDPSVRECHQTFAYCDMVPLPGLTEQNYKVTLYRLIDYDPVLLCHIDVTKAFFMLHDCRFTVFDIDGTDALCEGEVQIFDLTGFTSGHVSRLSISTLRIYLKFLQVAFPVRLIAIHLINCPPFMGRVIRLMKPFVDKKVFNMIRIHKNGFESLFVHVPRAMLPEEYGGNAGKMEDLKAEIMELLEEKREYLMDPDKWRADISQESSGKWWKIF